MAFDPFAGPSREFFGRSRFSDSANQESQVMANLAGDAVANKNYVLAAKRASEYQKQMMDYQAKLAQAGQPRQPSTGSQIGGAVAGAAISAGISLI
jgi:2-keto-4-pentenoate hydratase